MPITAMPCSLAILSSKGCSARQGRHQEAKKLTATGCPFNAARESGAPPASSAGSSSAGAGLPISAEGKAPGSRWGSRPRQKIATRTATSRTGNRYSKRRMMMLRFRDLHGGGLDRRADAVAHGVDSGQRELAQER